MQIPDVPQSGQNWKSAVLHWIRSAVSYMKRTRIIPDNKTVFATYTSDGMILSSVSSGRQDVNGKYYPAEYTNFFKIIENDEGNIEVINGTNPESEYCGLCDLGVVIDDVAQYCPISREVFTPEEIGDYAEICLGGYWNDETGYNACLFLKNNLPDCMINADRSVVATEIGTVRKIIYEDGTEAYSIYQTYQGGFFYFGRSYLL